MAEALAHLERLPCPTITAINIPVHGGDAEFAIDCELRLIAANAAIGFVHPRLGIVPAWGGGQHLLQFGLSYPPGEAFRAERAEFPLLWDTDYRRKAAQAFLNKSGENGRDRRA